jgi:hypothetical protein
LKEVETALTIDEMDRRSEIEKSVLAIKLASEREKIELNESMKHKLESVAAIEDGKKKVAKKHQDISDEAIKAANEHHAIIDKERKEIDNALAHLKILQKAHQDSERRRVILEEKISSESLNDLDYFFKSAVE